MNTFVNNIKNQEARTANGMKARRSTGSACVDLFYQIGAMRGRDIIPAFTKAYLENKEVALRIALWARDVRGGAGERKIFRDILEHLENTDPDAAYLLMNRTPELGRWDDILILDNALKNEAFKFYADALKQGDGLAAKWAPRKGVIANELRKTLGLTPKEYRKLLVENTKVVEQQMCAKDWDNINFSHVPSRAAQIYKKAFARHTPKYQEYLDKLKTGDKTVKVNANAIFPHDVIKELAISGYTRKKLTPQQKVLITKQWESLPNYMDDSRALAMVDVSGSMWSPVAQGISAIDVSVSLGLYMADKALGPFKDTFLTFSGNPALCNLKGDIVQKVEQMASSDWGMNTDLHKALEKILNHGKKFSVPENEMPAMLVILSDMQFDSCVRYDDSAIEMMRRKYENSGYTMPQVVFWNLNSYENTPVKSNEAGVALISGFSPSILKSVLSANPDAFTPEGIMMKTIMNERYNLS